MGGASWDRALAIAPADLIDTTLELHWAAQLIASAGQTFAEPRDDDSHRAMTWSSGLGAFVGADFAGPYPFRLALRPVDLALVLLDRADGVLSVFELQGRSRQDAYDWLALGMATYRGGSPPVIERPEYDMPRHPVGGRAAFSRDRSDELAALSALYASAAATLVRLYGDLDEASEVRCWPHHFDIATLLTLEAPGDAEESRTLGVGLAPMGGGYETWYLYVTPRPYPGADDLPALRRDGRWHTDEWTGAVLPGAEVMGFDPGERSAPIEAFLTEATEAARKALA